MSPMAKGVKSYSIPINIRTVSIALPIIGSVFYAGFYCGDLIRELKDNDEVMKMRIELLNIKSEYENKIYSYREEIYKIKLDNIKPEKNEK